MSAVDDDFCDDTPSRAARGGTEVDLSALEGSKENIQPLRAGRNPRLLLHALAVQQNTAELSAERQKHEDAIKTYTGDDPLAPWLAYIEWTQQTYVSCGGGGSDNLLKLLEACTSTFQTADRYRDDVRYLRVWLSYADLCRDAHDIFAYLKTHKIGLGHALLYTSWAGAAESSGKFAFAVEVLTYAVRKKLAQPHAVLVSALSALQARIKAHDAAVAANGSADGSVLTPAAMLEIAHSKENARKPLSHLNKDRNQIRAPPVHVNGTAVVAAAPSASSTPHQKKLTLSARPAGAATDAKANQRIAVYSDAAGTPAAAAAGADGGAGGLAASLLSDDAKATRGSAAADTNALGSENSRRKENERQTSKWTGDNTSSGSGAGPAVAAARETHSYVAAGDAAVAPATATTATFAATLAAAPRAAFTVFADEPEPDAATASATATTAPTTAAKPRRTLTLRARMETPAQVPVAVPAPDTVVKPQAPSQPLAAVGPAHALSNSGALRVRTASASNAAPAPAPAGSVVKKPLANAAAPPTKPHAVHVTNASDDLMPLAPTPVAVSKGKAATSLAAAALAPRGGAPLSSAKPRAAASFTVYSDA